MKTLRRMGWILVAVMAACLGAFGDGMAAEGYPSKPIRLIVPFAPGGFNDFTARLLAVPLGSALGQPVVVENRAGAGGTIGTEVVARANPDGYTLIVGSVGTQAVNQALYPNLPFNVLRDFQPIARLTESPSILAVHPSLPVNSVKYLIAMARAKPGQINYASAGAGSSTHLAAVLFEYLAHVKLTHVAYKGGGPMIIATISGEVPVTFGTASSVWPQVKSGKLRALAVTGSQRAASLPELMTIAEAGLPGYAMDNWLGLFAPVGTPRPVVEKISNEAIRIVRLPEVRKEFLAHGAEPSPLGPDEFAKFVKVEVEKWGKVVKSTGMTIN